MIFPETIKHGECAALIAPSSPVTEAQLPLCIKGVERLGYDVVLGETLKACSDLLGYLAGTARQRAADVNAMFADPDIKAIFAIRGGYGSSQILEYLDYAQIRENPKIFIGYSDVTNLHTVLQDRCHLVTFHGPMAIPNLAEGLNAYSWKSMMTAFHMKKHLNFKNPPEENMIALHEGEADGIITGGNLAVLARSCGTPFQADARGKLLFLEDVNETIPRIDMYLTQLKQAGLLDGVKGILLGGFLIQEQSEEDTDAFFQEWFAPFDIPVLAHIRSDHRIPMGTLPFGCRAYMDATAGSLSFQR